MNRNNLASIITGLLIVFTGAIYNNCSSFLFEKFGGSEPLSAEHRDRAIEIFELYKTQLETAHEFMVTYISNTDKFLNRELSISLDDYYEDMIEDIDYVIDMLNHDNIWYYVANVPNVGAVNYGGTPTIRESRFDDLEIELIGLGGNLEDHLNIGAVKLIFYDLLHEGDHSITPRGHAPVFQASNNSYVDVSTMTRTELLEHYFDGNEFTYYVERGYTQMLVNFWIVLRQYSENQCYGQCLNTMDSLVQLSFLEDFEWFGVSTSVHEEVIEDFCEIREIPRDADAAGTCNRHPAIVDFMTNLCECGELLVRDYENKNAIVIGGSSIEGISTDDFLYFSNVTQAYLAGNDLTSIGPNLFEHLTSLEELNLSVNPISHLDPQSFYGLNHLKILELRRGELSDLPLLVFSNLSGLEDLNLSSNNLSELPVNIFKPLSNLKTLDLSMNQLATIEPGVFNGLANLETLVLLGNGMENLPEGWWIGLVNIKTIKLQSNRFTPQQKSAIMLELQNQFPGIALSI